MIFVGSKYKLKNMDINYIFHVLENNWSVSKHKKSEFWQFHGIFYKDGKQYLKGAVLGRDLGEIVNES